MRISAFAGILSDICSTLYIRMVCTLASIVAHYFPRSMNQKAMDAVEEFNATIKKMVKFASPKLLGRLDGVVDLPKRVRLLLEEAPLVAMEAIGPSLDLYKQQIAAEDEKFFMTADFSSAIPKGYLSFKKEILATITVLRTVYEKYSNAEEQKQVRGDFKKLLELYLTYMKNV